MKYNKCKQIFNNKQGLSMHEKTCVTKDYSISESIGEKEELECLNCNKNFTTNKKLENHKKKCK